ncbi:MAG: serine hydrolase [Spirochaetales bacterium]|nr:serine hydrolase [Spirochaetales bacterium]
MDFNVKLERFCEIKKFSGVVTINRSGKQVISKAFGLRDLPNKLLNNSDTLFGIASGTKTFTALGIIKMIEQGYFDYSTTVYEILEKDVTFIHSRATIKNLLCHTSGIYDYYDEELITDFDNFEVAIPWFKLENPSDYYPLFESKKYKFSPGERFSYSNGGYIFLGIIIEKLTGQKYREFIAENILDSAKMDSSGFFAFNALPENTALGYIQTDDGFISNIYKLPIRGASDGGMYTNAHDLDNFWNSLFSLRIISEGNLLRFTHQETSLGEIYGYGMGIYTATYHDNNCYAVIGGDAGVGFISHYIPQTKTTINVLSNHTNGEEGIIDFIREEGEKTIL